MTVLSDRDIAHELAHGQLKIEGLDPKDIGPASVDVYLGDTLDWGLGEGPFCMGIGGLSLAQGDFILASTVETIFVPDNMACQVHGCSSIGRTGLFVQNAGWVDPGFRGQLTLELFNAGYKDYVLRTGQRIAQLTFHYLHSRSVSPYGSPGHPGRYTDQHGATAARPPKENS